MFSFPVTVPIRKPEGIFPIDVMVAIDDIAVVKSLDKVSEFGVCSASPDEFIPSSEIIFVDGHKLPVLEKASTLHEYLDAYITLDEFFTLSTRPVNDREHPDDNVVYLSTRRPCNTSEGSTPD